MSDETPTQRYPVDGEPIPPADGQAPADATVDGASGMDPAADAPTEILAPPPSPPDTAAAATGDEPPKRSKGLMIALICIGAAVLLALIILLIGLFTSNGTPEPTTSPTASSPTPTPSVTTPSPTPTNTDEPPDAAGPSIANYSVDQTQVDCSAGGPVGVTFVWQTTGKTLWFGVGTDDASAEPFGTFPTTHTLPFNYQCGQTDSQQRYTITVQGENGDKTSQTLVIRETK